MLCRHSERLTCRQPVSEEVFTQHFWHCFDRLQARHRVHLRGVRVLTCAA